MKNPCQGFLEWVASALTSVEAMRQSFWVTPASAEYEKFAVSLPSDRVAYAMAYYFLDPLGKAILDFGCYNGTSTNNIRIAGANSVTGVDIDASEISRAKLTYAAFPNLSFHHIINTQAIPADAPFDGAAMTFVHPTIPDATTLASVFGRLARVVVQGGILVLLGLHQKSFEPGCTFLNYFHRLPAGFSYTDGQPFLNGLSLRPKECLQFIDYCWTERTLIRLLQEGGFKVLHSIGLKADELDTSAREFFETELKTTAAQEGLRWQSEWTAPLYHIVVAERHL